MTESQPSKRDRFTKSDTQTFEKELEKQAAVRNQMAPHRHRRLPRSPKR